MTAIDTCYLLFSCVGIIQREKGATSMNELETPLTPLKAAKYLGISEATLRLWRAQGQGPRFFRAGKLIRFRIRDLNEWIEQRLSAPAGETR